MRMTTPTALPVMTSEEENTRLRASMGLACCAVTDAATGRDSPVTKAR